MGTGTSQGIPVLGSDHPVCLSKDQRDRRMRSSIIITKNNKHYLIDCGPDFRTQFLGSGYQSLDAVLITHEHFDHIGGLEDLRPFNYFQPDPMPIYALPRVVESIERRYYYLFSENPYPGNVKINVQGIGSLNPIGVGEEIFIPIAVKHGKLDILGYRIDDVAYITDGSYIPESELEKLKNLDTLIINALRTEPHKSHFHLEESLRIVEILQPRCAYFTHISAHLGFHAEVEATLPQHVRLAYDGLRLFV